MKSRMPAPGAKSSRKERTAALLFINETGKLKVVTDRGDETDDGTMFPVMRGEPNPNFTPRGKLKLLQPTETSGLPTRNPTQLTLH